MNDGTLIDAINCMTRKLYATEKRVSIFSYMGGDGIKRIKMSYNVVCPVRHTIKT